MITLLSTGTPLAILEPAKKAKAEIGKANQWLSVRPLNNQRGYVSAEYVALP